MDTCVDKPFETCPKQDWVFLQLLADQTNKVNKQFGTIFYLESNKNQKYKGDLDILRETEPICCGTCRYKVDKQS